MTYELSFPADTRDGLLAEYRKASNILEYGTGGSTVYAAQLTGKTIVAVESDKRWLDGLLLKIASNLRSNVIPVHVDIGPTQAWGHPVNRNKAEFFPNYSIFPWRVAYEHQIVIDLVLIDGRFRVACFLASLAMTNDNCRIVFDDYLDRPSYHVVEKFCKPSHFLGRAAIFDVQPNQISARDVLEQHDFFFSTQ